MIMILGAERTHTRIHVHTCAGRINFGADVQQPPATPLARPTHYRIDGKYG